ncbi:hypothetical protein O181_122222 [Austropuccinia psidii MF-1]|uniref:Uncharacterized protein n=1 Tax=Austropuccinia psidii MF-1 TaxID=1389203 RepID=A0A9Q3KKE5_9BASI|nr:hypothetical protein [Austropuccinia psidii MF-1]
MSIMASLKVLVTTQDLPCNFGEVRILWSWTSLMGPGHVAPEAPANLGSGASNSPHSPWTVGPQNHQKDQMSQNDPNHHRKGHDPKSRVGPIGPKKPFFEAFSGIMGTRPPIEDFEGIPIKAGRAKTSIGPFTMRYMNIYSLVINF